MAVHLQSNKFVSSLLESGNDITFNKFTVTMLETMIRILDKYYNPNYAHQ